MKVRLGVTLLLLVATASACGDSTKSSDAASNLSLSSKSATTTANSAATSAKSSSDTADSAPSTTLAADPCKLVTDAEATALAGTALASGLKSGASDDMSCTWVGDPNGPTAQVELFVGLGAKKFLDVDRSLDHQFTTLPDVGDEAYLEDFTLFFRTGTRWNALRLTRLDDFAAYRQPMIDLAKKVVAQG